FQRHIEFHYGLHLNRLVEQLEDLHRDRPFKQLVIGCGEETSSELLKMLPENLRERVIGTFRVDFKHESEAEILQRAQSLREEDERRSERELVDQIVGAAESGGRGGVGVDDDFQVCVGLRGA